jgi:hypothetical protein
MAFKVLDLSENYHFCGKKIVFIDWLIYYYIDTTQRYGSYQKLKNFIQSQMEGLLCVCEEFISVLSQRFSKICSRIHFGSCTVIIFMKWNKCPNTCKN